MAGIFDRFNVDKYPLANLIGQQAGSLMDSSNEAKNLMANNVLATYTNARMGNPIGSGAPSISDIFQRAYQAQAINKERNKKGIQSIKDTISGGGTEGYRDFRKYTDSQSPEMSYDRLQLAGRNNQI